MSGCIKELLVKLGRLLAFAIVAASTGAVIFSLAMIAVEHKAQSTQVLAANMVGCFIFCLLVGFGVAAFFGMLLALRFLLHHFVIVLLWFPEYMKPKSLRGAFMYAIGLAAGFTVKPMFGNLNHLGQFLFFYLLCVGLGLAIGAVWMQFTRRNIADGRLVFQRATLADEHASGYWRELSAILGVGGAVLFLHRFVPGSDNVPAELLGLFLGIGLYGLFWVLRYERGNNIRIMLTYAE